jgi:hypothetical protein
VATGILWQRSYHGVDIVSVRLKHQADPGYTYCELSSVNGAIRFLSIIGTNIDSPGHPILYGWQGLSFTRGDHVPARVPGSNGGFGWPANRQSANETLFWFPHWLVLGVMAVLPVLLWMKRIRSVRMQNRFAHGLCLVCGYDLRATPDRCPECGTVPEKGPATVK